jgi:hypothetical protein
MTNITVITPFGGSELKDTPSVALIAICERDILKILECQKLATLHELSEVRFTKSDIKYPEGDYDFCTAEVVVCGIHVWIETLFSAYEIADSLTTHAVNISDLAKAFESAQSGDLVFLGDDLAEAFVFAAENCEEWGLNASPVGYQVKHLKTGLHWNGRGNNDVMTFSTASRELKLALADSQEWSRIPVRIDFFDYPFFGPPNFVA